MTSDDSVPVVEDPPRVHIMLGCPQELLHHHEALVLYGHLSRRLRRVGLEHELAVVAGLGTDLLSLSSPSAHCAPCTIRCALPTVCTTNILPRPDSAARLFFRTIKPLAAASLLPSPSPARRSADFTACPELRQESPRCGIGGPAEGVSGIFVRR